MRRAAKVDRNQQAIVEAWRGVGASVTLLHQVGQGCPDAVVGYQGVNLLVEIKGPRGTLTPDEREWHDSWRGRVYVVRNVDEALALLRRALERKESA